MVLEALTVETVFWDAINVSEELAASIVSVQ
jgi:hypothetical protein